MQVPIGLSDFRRFVTEKDVTGEGFAFVDKTLLIRDLLKDLSSVILFTRPRRFGKTTNLSMLHYFFAAEIDGKPTAGLFDGLKISQYPECMQHQGKYPVIFISLKEAKYENFNLFHQYLSSQIADLYHQFKNFVYESNISEELKIYFKQVLNGNADIIKLEKSLLKLSQILHEITNQQCIILIDEYDTPIHEAYINNYYDKMISFMRNFFGSTLKDNRYMKKGILTGILRVSKEGLFSSVNNVVINSIFSKRYSNYFGFTEEETNELMSKLNLPVELQQTKEWYNGYNFGGTTIYNPWSIAEFIKKDGILAPYWVNTSGNYLIKELIINADPEPHEQLSNLLSGKNLQITIDEHLTFGDLYFNNSSFWNLFLISGYLKIVSLIRTTVYGIEYEVAIPNKEIESLYIRFIREWISGRRELTWYREFLSDLENGRVLAFEEKLQTIITEIISCRDVTKKSQEAFYHGLMLAFVSGLKETHEIKSNKESGKGFYDVAVIPKDVTKLGVVMEFKIAKDDDDLELKATEALKQIEASQYVSELENRGITEICKMGIAFSKKEVRVISNNV